MVRNYLIKRTLDEIDDLFTKRGLTYLETWMVAETIRKVSEEELEKEKKGVAS